MIYNSPQFLYSIGKTNELERYDDSFYPMLISEGNYTKAYSIQSTLESVTIFMVPASAFLYNAIGIAPLFLINMGSFFLVAIMETQIHQEECYVKKEEEEFGLAQYKKTFVEGVAYLRNERGLLAVTSYFTVSFLPAVHFPQLFYRILR